LAGAANTASASVRGVSTPAAFNATVAAGPVATVTLLSGDGQTGPVGAALANPLVIEARDAFANPVAGAAVSVAPCRRAVAGGRVGEEGWSGTGGSGSGQRNRGAGPDIR